MKLSDFIAGVLVMALWGINFSVIKMGVSEIDPLLLTALRFTLVCFPIIFFVKKPDVSWSYLISYGLIFGIGIWGMGSWSIEAGLSVGMASVLLQMNVVIGLFLGYLLLKEAISKQKLVGACIAICGLLLSLTVNDGSVTMIGFGLILCAALAWSVSSIIIKRSGTKQVFAFAIWSMIFAPLPLLLIVFLKSGSEPFVLLTSELNHRVIFSVLFQAYPVTLLGYWVWNRLLVKYPLTTVAPLTLLVPIFGLLGGFLFYQEQIGAIKALACLMVISGLLIGLLKINRSQLRGLFFMKS
jgi:drug/metabolite transporter (DMT)-like permease